MDIEQRKFSSTTLQYFVSLVVVGGKDSLLGGDLL